MAGLLDFEDPNTAGAMQLGLGLLNAGGPSRMPVSLGQGIAQGGTMAMDAMRQARQDLLKKKLMQIEAEKGQLSMDQVKAELATDKAFQEEFKNVGKPPDMNKLMQIDPMRAMKLKDYLAPKPITVGDNQRVLMPDAAAPTGFKTILDSVPKVEKPMSRTRVDGDKEVFEEYDATAKKWTEVSRGPRFAKQIGGSGVTEKKISTIDARSIDKSLEKSSGANGALQLLDQADALYGKYESNRAEPILGGMARVGAAFGMSDPKKAKDYELADQISKDLGVIKLGLIGGSDTERELKVAIDTSPSPDKTVGTNREIIKNQRKAIEILQSEPDFKTEWVNKHGSLSAMDKSTGDTYGKAWRKFQKEKWGGGSGLSAQEQAELDQLRTRFGKK